MCKVNIIMPVYNVDKSVSRAIESLLGQTFTDFELIIIDDGSAGNSLKIIKSYSDSKMKVTEKGYHSG